MATEVEVRCPVNSQGLMFKLIGSPTAEIVAGNSIEITCGGCRDSGRREGRTVLRVVHEFNLLGELIGTREYCAEV
jgi:hypothetical protein